MANKNTRSPITSREVRVVDDGLEFVVDRQLIFNYNTIYRVDPATSTFKLKRLGANREVRRNILLEKSIDKDGIITPITVDNQLRIVDGQHRYEYAMKKKIPYDFMIRPYEGDVQEMIIRLNNSSHKWTILDEIVYFAKRGNDNYKQLIETIQEMGDIFSPSFAGKIAEGIWSPTIKNSNNVRTGNFKYYNKDSVKEFYNIAKTIQNTFNISLKRDFLAGLYSLYAYKNFNPNRLLRKMRNIPNSSDVVKNIVNSSDTHAVFSELVRIYNLGLGDKSPDRITTTFKEHPKTKMPIFYPDVNYLDSEKVAINEEA